ncbi:MAG: MaoC family dehydratase N-terminal domain-containing protein [Sphingomonadaceae bacterium]|nr:MaoC family dehydratase N-terminal domain-containing protein [Sphingomonadaceae bacterium]
MINAAALLRHDFGETTHCWDRRDAILYALGVGMGHDPMDREDLRYLDERELSVLPSMAVTLASPGMWIRNPKFGITFGKLVHSAQSARFANPLPPEGTVVGTARVTSLTDRGEGKGAVLVLERTIRDAADGTEYCRLEQTLLLRGDGGFGGPPASHTEGLIPETEPHCSQSLPVSPRAALIYRLSGDWNPLHLDPDFAQTAGFPRPILHGLASYAMAGIVVSRALGKNAARVCQLACRFSGVVLPGDKLRFDIWHDGAKARFQAFVDTRKVLDAGAIEWSD